MSTENTITLVPGDEAPSTATTCTATETFHHFCGHITISSTKHSPHCETAQNPSRPGTASSISRTGTGLLTRTGRSRSSTLNRIADAISSTFSPSNLVALATSLTIPNSGTSSTTEVFSFTSRVFCPQLLVQPLYETKPCASCAKAWEMTGKEKEVQREIGEEELDEWNARDKVTGKEMKVWEKKMDEWEAGMRVVRLGGKGRFMRKDSDQ